MPASRGMGAAMQAPGARLGQSSSVEQTRKVPLAPPPGQSPEGSQAIIPALGERQQTVPPSQSDGFSHIDMGGGLVSQLSAANCDGSMHWAKGAILVRQQTFPVMQGPRLAQGRGPSLPAS
jgi:hypothetical protein